MEVDRSAYIEGGTSRRMGEADLLLTTAGIAVVFAGSSGLISVIGRGSARDPRLAAFLLCFVLEVSLFAVAFSLLPLLMIQQRAVARRVSEIQIVGRINDADTEIVCPDAIDECFGKIMIRFDS